MKICILDASGKEIDYYPERHAPFCQQLRKDDRHTIVPLLNSLKIHVLNMLATCLNQPINQFQKLQFYVASKTIITFQKSLKKYWNPRQRI